MHLSARELEVLQFFARQPASVSAYRGSIPPKTVYRIKDKLARLRLVREVGGKEGEKLYAVTDEGLRTLRPPGALDVFQNLYPPAAFCPTRCHKALLAIIAAAAHARRFQLGDQQHAAIVIVGPTLRWKSWLGTLVCHMLSVNPEEATMIMSSESGRSVFVRKGYAGAVVSEREVLRQPIAVLDEFHRSNPTTRRLAEVYLHGRLQMPSEAQPIPVTCVPVVLMNSIRSGDIDAKTGLTAAVLRRCVIADLENIEIPVGVREFGGELLERSRNHSLPWKQPSSGPSAFLDETSRALDAALLPSARTLVDAAMIAKLAAGLTGHLNPEVALRLILEAYLVTAETLGRTKPGWPAVLEGAVEEAVYEPTSISPETGDLRSRVLAATSGVETSLLDFLPRAERIDAACRTIEVEPEEVIALTSALKQQGRKLGRKPAAIANGLPRTREEVTSLERRADEAARRRKGTERVRESLVRDMLNLRSGIEALKKELADLEELRSLNAWLRENGFTAKGKRDAVALLERVHSFGWTVDDLEVVRQEFATFPGGIQEATRQLRSRLSQEKEKVTSPQQSPQEG